MLETYPWKAASILTNICYIFTIKMLLEWLTNGTGCFVSDPPKVLNLI